MASDPIGKTAPQWAADLWLALLAGPAAASLQLSVNYALVKWACRQGGAWVLWALTAAFMVVSVIGVALALVHLVRAGDRHPATQIWSTESRRLLAMTAVGLDALVVVFLLNSMIALQVLSPCE